MSETFYEIEDESRFHIKLKEVKNLEDVVGEFLSEEEVREIVGEGGYISTYSPIVKNNVVKDYLNGLIATAKEKKAKTIIIDDEELIEFLKKYDYAVSQFITGLRRVGNRLFVNAPQKKEQTEPKKRDIQTFISAGVNSLNTNRGVKLDLKYAYEDYEYAVGIIKKLTTLEEIKEWVNSSRYGGYSDSLPFFDMIWEDVAKYLPKKEETA